ncbi:MAG TPA: hypothetical protein VKC63_04260 [Solirubrobacterales bacterium]|nr:hypothetical protein [Solirubrobacterales bacterium]
MQAWTTPKPLPTPIAFDGVNRIDLEFVDVHRDAGSFTAFVFLNAGKLRRDAGRDHDRFAGSFTLFTRTECWGGEGHCDWKRGPVSAFDRRPQHHLTPINVSMDVTETIRHLGNPNRLEVTVHAIRAGDPAATKGVLRFEQLTVMSYA